MQLSLASIQQTLCDPDRIGFTAAQSLQINILNQCILWSLIFHFFHFRGPVTSPTPIDAVSNTLSNQLRSDVANWRFQVPTF